jgi:polysaccharide export outer membrane protein
MLLLSWLLLQPGPIRGQDAAVGVSYNPLRSGEEPWNRDRPVFNPLAQAAQPQAQVAQPIPTSPPPQTRTPKWTADPLWSAKPMWTPLPSPATFADAKLWELVAARDYGATAMPPSPTRREADRTSAEPRPVAAPLSATPAPTIAEKQQTVAQRPNQDPLTPFRQIALQREQGTIEPAPTPTHVRAPTKRPVAAAQAPRPNPSVPVRPVALQPAQAMLEPMPLPPEGTPEWLPPGAAPPIEDNMPLTGTHPQLWLPCEPNGRCGVTCPNDGSRRCEHRWHREEMIPWQVFAQGEYVGPARLAHVPQYHLRVDDDLRMIYGLTGEPSAKPYLLAVGDVVQVESNADPKINRSVTIQPDGMLTLRYLGQVRAAGVTIEDLRKDLESNYLRFVREPAISVTPVKLNSRVEELRQAVDQRYGRGGQGVYVRVTPAGTVQLPSIGSIAVQGLTLDEVKREIEARYARRFHGVEVTPVLERRAPRYLFVLGEVRNPGRFELQGPTTAMQAIAMAGGWNVGAELKRIVVFRRDDCWRLMATQLHLCNAVRGKQPCPADEIWLRDSDILLVPKSGLLETDDMINLLFTRGLYGVVPFNVGLSWTNLTAL